MEKELFDVTLVQSSDTSDDDLICISSLTLCDVIDLLRIIHNHPVSIEISTHIDSILNTPSND